MKILLIIPPLPERTYPGKTMGPDYLAKALLDQEYDVDILDLDVLDRKELISKLEDYKPNIVGVTNLSIQNDVANEIAKEVKGHDKNTLVVKGGFHELFGWEYTLQHHHEYVDYVVVGEGEQTIVELVRSYKNSELQRKRQHILGLAYYDYETKAPRFSGKRPFLSHNELDEMVPARLFYHKLYDFEVFDNKKTAQMMTVRGCANACNYCMESQTGHKERKRSIDSIYSELYNLQEQGYEAVYFDDSTFTRSKDRVRQICELFKTDFPDMIWGCNTRDDFLDEELIRIMENSGCVYMFTGFESAIPEVLLGMNKTHNPKKYLSNAKSIYAVMKDSSIKSSVFLVFGSGKKIVNNGIVQFEPETFNDVMYTINFVLRELKPRYLAMNILRILPGAPFSKHERYRAIRPVEGKIHAGYYDKMWYQQAGGFDLRTKHHIYRAFEGRGSVVPPNMTPNYCYKILKYAIDVVNRFNEKNGYKCKMVMDKEFEDVYVRKINGQYEITPFEEMGSGKILQNFNHFEKVTFLDSFTK